MKEKRDSELIENLFKTNQGQGYTKKQISELFNIPKQRTETIINRLFSRWDMLDTKNIITNKQGAPTRVYIYKPRRTRRWRPHGQLTF